MNKFFYQCNQIVTGLFILLLIQACGSKNISQNTVTPLNNQQSIERLLIQIKKADINKKAPLLVQAAQLLVSEKRYEKAQELIIRVNQQHLTPDQLADFHLYYGEILLALNAEQAALNQLLTVSSLIQKSIAWQVRYNQSLADAYLAVGNYFESAKLRIDLEDLIEDATALVQNNEKIWFVLNQLETNFLQQLITDFNSQRLNGWLEVVYINKRWGYHPKKLLQQIELWRNRYPLHPSLINQPTSLQQVANAETFAPNKIAVLLPFSGKNAIQAKLVNDGIMAAHYRAAQSGKAPQLSFYNTANSLSALTPYQNAIDEGAEFILGPLTKDSLETISNQEKLAVPMLALNRLTDQDTALPNFFQFGLSPEDEAIQSAHRAYEKGYRKAIAFVPGNAVGKRVENAFSEYFERLGGELVDVHNYNSAKALKQDVQRMLGVDKSGARKKSLQQLLGRNLIFEERRRQDVDLIFIMASPEMGRSIKPFIDFYYAHDLPVIATASIYSGKRLPKKDIDLNGIEFSDIPLLISELEYFKDIRADLAQSMPEALDSRGRLFALGFDSYEILTQLSIMQAFPEYRWNGLTGELGVDKQGIVHRFLTWAQFNRGVPHITLEREVKQPEQNNSRQKIESNNL